MSELRKTKLRHQSDVSCIYHAREKTAINTAHHKFPPTLMDYFKEMEKSTVKEAQGSTRKIPALTKRRSSSTSEVEEIQKVLQPPLRERPSSENDLSKTEKHIVADPSKGRFQTSFSSSEYFSHYDSSSKLTEQAKHLSEEQMEALELDILKPLDFFELLFKRMKIRDNEARSGQTEDQSEEQISSE